MFTGIIEETGIIKNCTKTTDGMDLVVECSTVLEGTQIGDSICVNGVCQTVVEIFDNSFKVNLSKETLNLTTFKNVKVGQKVNLERALTLNSRLGGHIVSGHVEGIATIEQIEQLSDYYNIKFKVDKKLLKYIVYKGSITINGISLTVANINDNIIEVAIIPHTYQNTCFKYLKNGDEINIETDIIAKYVENMMKFNEEPKTKIDMDFLAQNGFV